MNKFTHYLAIIGMVTTIAVVGIGRVDAQSRPTETTTTLTLPKLPPEWEAAASCLDKCSKACYSEWQSDIGKCFQNILTAYICLQRAQLENALCGNACLFECGTQALSE